MASKPTPHETAQDCYTMAYFVLPEYVNRDAGWLVKTLAEAPLGAAYVFGTACRMNGREPDADQLHSFPVHHGDLDDGNHYTVIKYPTPPAVDLASLESQMESGGRVVLAPYFSTILFNRQTNAARYFVLGQSPDGLTTLRAVTPTLNANLGRGCEPVLDRFLDLLRQRTERTKP